MKNLFRAPGTWAELATCWLLACCWILFTSAVLSLARAPLTLQYDMSVYHVVGREWLLHGLVPYRDLVDIKGPLIFFEYGLGALASPFSLAGAALIHSIAAGFALFFAWRSALLYMGRVAAATVTILASAVLASYYGNPSETVLAFQMAALYLFLRRARLGGKEPLAAYGALAGAVFAIKFNLTAFFVPMVAVSLVRLAHHGGWRMAAAGVGKCAAGFACVLLPFIVYFACMDALDDLWRYYILAGFRYGATPLSSAAMLHPDAGFLAHFTPGLPRFGNSLPKGVFAVLGLLAQFGGLIVMTLRRHSYFPCNRYAAATLWLCWAFCLYAIFRGPYAYYHYFVSFYPFAFLTLLAVGASFARGLSQGMTRPPRKWAALLPCVLAAAFLAHMIDLCHRQFALRHAHDMANIATIHGLLASPQGPAPSMLTLQPYLAVFHRVSPHPPANRNAFPQMTTRGKAHWNAECLSLLRSGKPRFVLAVTSADGTPVQDTGDTEHPPVTAEIVQLLGKNYALRRLLRFDHVPAFRYVGVFERRHPAEMPPK